MSQAIEGRLGSLPSQGSPRRLRPSAQQSNGGTLRFLPNVASTRSFCAGIGSICPQRRPKGDTWLRHSHLSGLRPIRADQPATRLLVR